MPLRSTDPGTGESQQATLLSDEAWARLREENRSRRHLRLPCCDSQVVLKTSSRGLRFFAHKGRGLCTSAPETEAHLMLKDAAVRAAIRNGWSAETEVARAGWRADVLAIRGDAQVAVEIQWSSQTNEETLRRQARYKEAGVRGLWLLRQPGFPVSRDLPAACIGGSPEAGLAALLPYYERMTARHRNDPLRWSQTLPIDDFLDAAFSGRLSFGLPTSLEAIAQVQTSTAECWWCKAPMRIIHQISIVHPKSQLVLASLSLEDFTKDEELLQQILVRLPDDPLRGPVKLRFSRTVGESYMSNGCPKCDGLFGKFFSYPSESEDEVDYPLPIRIDDDWRRVIVSHTSSDYWRVF